MASEKTLLTAIALFEDPSFRASREESSPGTIPLYDARAAAFEAMDQEGRFNDTIGMPMTPEEDQEFELIASAVLKMSETKGE